MQAPNTIKHLLILTPGFPDGEEDTTCLPAVQQFIAVYKTCFPEISIDIIALQYPHVQKQYTWMGIPVHAIGGRNRKKLGRLKTIWSARNAGLAIHRKQSIDAILSFWLTDAAFAGKLITERIHKPHYIWMHGQDARKNNKYVRRVKPNADQLVAISDYQNNIFYESFGYKAGYVVNNGVNESIFPGFNTGERSIDIIAVGSLIPLKQPHLFIELVLALKKSYKENIKAALVGAGPLKDELQTLIDKYDLQDNIRLTGEVLHREVLELMNHSKVLVHPSLYEGHSTVMLEALFSGCKVVSFIPPGSREVPECYICTDFDEMHMNTLKALQEHTHTRVKYTDMRDSVMQLHRILFQ